MRLEVRNYSILFFNVTTSVFWRIIREIFCARSILLVPINYFTNAKSRPAIGWKKKKRKKQLSQSRTLNKTFLFHFDIYEILVHS